MVKASLRTLEVWRKTPIIMFAELFGMFSQLFELLDELVELFELFAALFDLCDELFRELLGSIESNVQADDFLWLQSHCCEFCVAVCAIVDNNLMFKLAGRRLAITHTHFCALHSKTKIKEVCVDTL